MTWSAKAREAAAEARRKGGKGVTKGYHGGPAIRGNVVMPGGLKGKRTGGHVYAAPTLGVPRNASWKDSMQVKQTALHYAKKTPNGRVAILNMRHRKTLTMPTPNANETVGALNHRIAGANKGTAMVMRISRPVGVIGYVPRLKDIASKARRKS